MANSLTLWQRIRRLLAWSGAGIVLCVGLMFALVQFASPFIESQHQRLEDWLSHEIGHQVQFQQIEMRWSIFMPVLVLKDFSVRAELQKEHWLEVDSMQFTIDWWQTLTKRTVQLGHWRVVGVDLDLAQISPGANAADMNSLLATFDQWITKNPTRIKQLTLHLPDVDGRHIDMVFDEIFLHKETGVISSLQKPALQPWLNQADNKLNSTSTPADTAADIATGTTTDISTSTATDKPTGELKQRLIMNGRAHLQGQPKRRISFVAESLPFTPGERLSDAKIFLDSQQFPLHLFPIKLGQLGKNLSEQAITAKMWIDVQKGEVAAVQSVVQSVVPITQVKSSVANSYSGHFYAVKDHQAGWWITADRLQLKFAHNPVISGRLALSYRDVQNGEIDWLMRVPQFSFTQGAATFSGSMQWRQSASRNPLEQQEPQPTSAQSYLQLAADVKNVSYTQLMKSLPKDALPAALTTWLQHALQAGVLHSGHINLAGDLQDILRGKPNATLSAQGIIHDAKLKFHPDWPSVTAQHIEFKLKQDVLTFSCKNNTFLQNPVKHITAQLDSLFNPDKVNLTLNIQSPLSLQQGQLIIQQTPLKATLGQRFRMLQLLGAGDLTLQIHLPLQQHESAKKSVSGQLTLQQAILKLQDWPIELNDLTGNVQFTDKFILANDLRGQLWHEKIGLQLTTQNLPPTAQMKVIAKTRVSLPGQSHLAPAMQRLPIFGSTPVEAMILLPQKLEEPLHLQLKSDLRGVQIALPYPLGKTFTEAAPTIIYATLQPTSTHHRYQIEYADKKVLIELDRISELASIWNMNFNDPDMFGVAKLSLSPNQSTLKGHFTKLYLNQSKQGNGQARIQPASLPSIDLLIDDFQLDKKQLGQLTLNTKPTTDGQEITKLMMESKVLSIHAQGKWTAVNQQQNTQLTGVFESTDLDRALKALTIKPSLESDKTHIEFAFNWPDTPYHFRMENLNGSGYFKLSDGRVMQLSKQTSQMVGIGRMLNMLSVSNIPKRLRLDFSDLTQKGLHFEKFKGKVTIQNGNAVTQDAQLEGPVARIRWRGRIGLAHRDYDLIMQVEPHVTSSLPIVAAIAGGPLVGPVAGVAAWMVNKTIAPGFEKISAYSYEVKGSWQQPVVRPVSHSRKR